MMFGSNNYTMQKVETMVCECVSVVMERNNRSPVSVDDVYVGKKNIPFGRAIARNFIFDLFHNRYGFSFSVISQRSDMHVISVMRCVRKMHDFVSCDSIYKEVSSLVESKLTEWYGEGK